MQKFHYLTSEDHAKWYLTSPYGGLEIPATTFDENPGLRVSIREWIEENCKHPVYAWNKTRTPATGEPNWGRLVMPQGNVMLHFGCEEDRILFKLTWT